MTKLQPPIGKELNDRIALQLFDLSQKKPKQRTGNSNQLLVDVLNELRIFYPGAYAHFLAAPARKELPFVRESPAVRRRPV